MTYTPTAWVDDSPPAISAANLQKLEQGVFEAHLALGATVVAPAATGDPTIDTPAVQEFLSVVQRTPVAAGIIGRNVIFPPGEYVLNASIVLDQWTGTLIGQGVGNSPAFTTDPGHATVFRWAGPAGQPMFLLTDHSFAGFEHIRLEGDDLAPPSYGIESRSAAGYGAGTGAHLMVRRCWIGKFAWSSQGTWKGLVSAGVGFTGDNSNNDQFTIQHSTFHSGTGIYLPNSQSIWGTVLDVFFASCAVGLDTAASVTCHNLEFDNCAIDVRVTGSPRVVVDGWWSERSAQFYDLAEGASLVVNGGKWQVMAAMQGAPAVNAQRLVANDLLLRGLHVDYTITPKPVLYARGGYAAIPYRIRIEGCKGLGEAELDVRGYGAPRVTFVDLDTGPVTLHTTMTNKALSTYVAPQTKTGAYTLVDGETSPVVANSASPITFTLPDAATCRPGATRFVVKNVGAGLLTVKSNGGTVDGAAAGTGITVAQWAARTITTDGTNWITI